VDAFADLRKCEPQPVLRPGTGIGDQLDQDRRPLVAGLAHVPEQALDVEDRQRPDDLAPAAGGLAHGAYRVGIDAVPDDGDAEHR
jgi:hypothetical protein